MYIFKKLKSARANDDLRSFKRIIIRRTTKLFARNIDLVSFHNVGIVSFDVFGTLLLRGVSQPEDVYDLVSKDPAFRQRRIEAERKARKRKQCEEVTIDQIYEFLPGYNSDEEINAEINNVEANSSVKKIFDWCRESGKKVIIISDMYLPRTVIELMLCKAGYDIEGVNIYVSSEYGLTKRSGKLFKTVIKNERSNAKDIVHIGDNLISDYIIPRLLGLRARIV